jgi:alpha-tubulin suppressor-like RCC1 family protein
VLGGGSSGQLGDASFTFSTNVPVEIYFYGARASKTIVAVSAGLSYTLALCTDGTILSWGSNSNGQLGDSTTSNRSGPVLVNTTNGVSALYGKKAVAISAGFYHSMALCSDGTVVSWGYNSKGQLGTNSTTQSLVPVAVSTTSGTSALYGKTVASISAGNFHSLAMCTDGTLVAWGSNTSGQLGINSTTQSLVPVVVNTTSGTSALYGKTAAALATGADFTLALCTDGTVTAWGSNTSGQLGNNSTTQNLVPILVNTASGTSALYGKTVTAIATGGSLDTSARAFCSDGTLATWGANNSGQLGNNSTINYSVPVSAITTSLASAERLIGPSCATNSTESLILAAGPPPAVTTLAAAPVGSTTTTLKGTVNSNDGPPVVASFEYGSTASYGLSITAVPSLVSGGSDTAVSAVLTGLTPLTTYHFRLNAGSYKAGLTHEQSG